MVCKDNRIANPTDIQNCVCPQGIDHSNDYFPKYWCTTDDYLVIDTNLTQDYIKLGVYFYVDV